MVIEDKIILVAYVVFFAPAISYYLVLIIEDDLLKGKNILYQASFKSVMMINSILLFPFITLIYVYLYKNDWLKSVKRYYKQLTCIA